MNKLSLIMSANISAGIAIIFVTAITIAGELYKVVDAGGKTINPIKEYLKSLHGHHWVGKGVWAVGLFAILTTLLYFVFRKQAQDERIGCTFMFLTYMLILGTATLFGFFVYEFLIAH